MSVSDVDEGDGVEGPAHNRLTCGITIWPMVSSSRNDWRQDSGRKQILFNQFILVVLVANQQLTVKY